VLESRIEEAAVAPGEPPRSPGVSTAVLWSAGWALAAVLTGIALALAFPSEIIPTSLALTAGAAPALISLLLRRQEHPAIHTLQIVLWAIGTGTACLLTGGLTGPLAAWCLGPVAAGALLAGGSRVAEGAALAMMAAALAALGGLAGLTPVPPANGALWLGLLALTTSGFGLGAGLLLEQRRGRVQDGRRDGELGRLRMLLSEQPHLIVSLYPHGKVRAVFGRAPEGIDTDRLVKGGLTAVALNNGVIAEALRGAITQGRSEVGFAPAGAPDRWVVASLRRVEDSLLLATLRDATMEQAREASLEQARADAESLAAGKSRFLANMSHELRTPLNAIMGFSDIMKAKLFGPLPERYEEYGSLIHESGAHLLDLINDVLDMSKIEAERYQLSREAFDAREAVAAALRLMRVQADGAGVQLRGVLPATPLDIDADRRALKQIVLNLVSNALKFTPKGGAVTVTVHGYDGVFELVVADTGVGIAQSDLERIGRPYEQAGDSGQRSLGTGLGLSLVRAFAELHGGEMIIESTVGEGTSVTVRLPVLLPPAASGGTGQNGDNVVAFTPQR
jgi:cell cycle sensor histidine kinase DivJ